MVDVIKEKIRYIHDFEGITYKRIAEKSLINYSTFRNYISGQQRLGEMNMERIINYLYKYDTYGEF